MNPDHVFGVVVFFVTLWPDTWLVRQVIASLAGGAR